MPFCNILRAILFLASFLDAALFTWFDTLFKAFLFKLLCNGHQCILVLWHPLCQFAYKGLCVWRFACLYKAVYQ